MTRKDMVDELNKLTLRYNLDWEEIEADADKAIFHINNYMGADYPPMSEIMKTDHSTYEVLSTRVINNVEATFMVPIIKPIYIQTVVIPFIAMEVLSRDEEFTTIFSKYEQEFHRGKYDMLVNEFNNIPENFKRHSDAGVFFPSNNKGKSRTRKW